MNDKTFKPTESMAAAAKRGLKMRDEQPDSNKCCESTGLKRASQLVKRESLSLDTVKRMYSFFSRHKVDKSSESWKKGDSKGEQAWLLWGGDAGYSWSKSIVEKEKKMKANKVVIIANVGKSQIEDTGDHWEIRNIPVTVDDAVMNNIYYPAEENKRGLPSLVGKPIALGHPIDREGNFISAREGEGLEDYFSGGTITNTYNMAGINYADARIKKSVLEAQDSDNFYSNALKNKDDVGVSTGLIIPQNNQSGETNKGEKYEQTAINQEYDHLAMLPPDEAPAGGDATFMRFNSEDKNLMVVNIGEYMPEKINEEEKKTLFNKFLDFIKGDFADNKDTSYNTNGSDQVGDHNQNCEETTVDKKKMMSLMKNMGIDMKDVENMDEDKMYNAMMEHAKNMGKKQHNEDMDKEKDKEKMAKNSADTPPWAKALVSKVESLENQITANAQTELTQLQNQAKALKVNGLDDAAINALPVDSLKSLIAANSGHINVNHAGGFAPQQGEHVLANMEAP